MKSEGLTERCEVLVCFAVKEEAQFRKFSKDDSRITKLITGIGRRNAEKSFRDFVQVKSPQRVFTCGFAGALNPALKLGDVICFTTDDALRAKLEGLKVLPA